MKKKEVSVLPAIKKVSKNVENISRNDILEVLLQEARENLEASVAAARENEKICRQNLDKTEKELLAKQSEIFVRDHVPVLSKYFNNIVEIDYNAIGKVFWRGLDKGNSCGGAQSMLQMDLSAEAPFLLVNYTEDKAAFSNAQEKVEFCKQRIKDFNKKAGSAKAKLLKSLIVQTPDGKDLLDRLRRDIINPMLVLE